MTIPHPHTSDLQGPQCVSTSTHTYMVMYTLAHEVLVGRRPRAGGAWTTFQLTGAARTALGIDGSAITDGHKFPTINVSDHNGVDETDDVVHIWANMHSNVLRYVKSDPGTITVFASADLPGEQDSNSYPVCRHVSAGGFTGLYFQLRAGPINVGGVGSADDRSGAGTYRHWRKPDGSSTWEELGVLWKGYPVDLDGEGPGSTLGHGSAWDTDQNFSAYPMGPEVEPEGSPHPGRLHVFWMWRAGVGTPSRSMIDAVTVAADPTVTSATGNFAADDVGMGAVGPWMDADGANPRYVGAVNSATSIELSSSATSNVPANPVGNQSATRLTINRNRSGLNATNGTPAVTVSVAGVLSSKDIGAPVSGTFIPVPAWIGEITSDTVFQLSSSPTSHVPVNATGTTTPVGVIEIGRGIEHNHINLSYAYSDDVGGTWQALGGVALDATIEPYTNPECHIGDDSFGFPDGFLNGGGVAIDPATGDPHATAGLNPMHHIYWDGDEWVDEVLGTSAGLTLAGVTVRSRLNPVFIYGELWYLALGGPTGDRRPYAFKADGSRAVKLGGTVGTTTVEWDVNCNPTVLNEEGVAEVLTPDGDTPKTFRFPTGTYGSAA